MIRRIKIEGYKHHVQNRFLNPLNVISSDSCPSLERHISVEFVISRMRIQIDARC